MSILKNLSNAFVPVREYRTASASIGALNAELALDVNGDQIANLYIVSSSLIATLNFEGSIDGVNYFPLAAFPNGAASVGGTLLQPGQPIITHAVVAANANLGYTVFCGQMKKIRVRINPFTSGNATCTWVADSNAVPSNMLAVQKPATLYGTNTGASAAAVTLTLPAVAGFRHVLKTLSVVRSATALLTAAATPVVVTTTNIPGSPALTFGADAAAQGADKEVKLDCGNGILTTAINTATTIVCPATTGVIWRTNAAYGLAL